MSDNVHDLSERFLAVLRGGRTPSRKIDDEEYAMFLMRAIRAWEARVIENPQLLPTNELLVQRAREITSVVIAANAERYARDPRSGASMKECARTLGIEPSSASERRKRGRAIMADRIARAGAVEFSEAKRERAAVEAAADHAVTSLAEYRARHARKAG